jgi:hypothetical protein
MDTFMNKKVKKILSALLVIILMSCGSSQTDVLVPQLSAGISPTTTSTNFGKAASDEEIKAMSAKLGSYFNGQYASNPKALMGAQATADKASGLSEPLKIAASNVASPVYRFFNTKTGAHFFTMSAVERDYVGDTFPFFNFEGNSFLAYPEADPTLSPVYRFYNNVTGTHFFTINAEEKAYVQATWPAIFTYEGISWYASTSESTSWVPVYRFFNTKTGTHFYTTSAVERDHVLATWNWFNFEGIAYYVKPAPEPLPFTSKLQDTGATKCFKKLASYSQDQQVLVDCTDPAAIAADPLQDGMLGYDMTHSLGLDGRLGFSFSNVAGFSKTDCVKDNITGLLWEGKPTTGFRADRGYTYYGDGRSGDISEYVAQVNAAALCGKTDWRIPSVNELHGLLDYGVDAAATKYTGSPMIDAKWFPNTIVGEYWTSSPATSIVAHPAMPAGKTWVVSFWNGIAGTASADYSSNRARLVSGGISISSNTASRYVISGDGKEVTDSVTGLIWRRCVEGHIWDASLATCTPDLLNFSYLAQVPGSHANFQGDAARTHVKKQTGWRIPNIKELKSLQDGGFNQVVFPSTDLSYGTAYRSSTPVPKIIASDFVNINGGQYWPNHASWAVWLGTGHVVGRGDEFQSMLRLVR